MRTTYRCRSSGTMRSRCSGCTRADARKTRSTSARGEFRPGCWWWPHPSDLRVSGRAPSARVLGCAISQIFLTGGVRLRTALEWPAQSHPGHGTNLKEVRPSDDMRDFCPRRTKFFPCPNPRSVQHTATSAEEGRNQEVSCYGPLAEKDP